MGYADGWLLGLMGGWLEIGVQLITAESSAVHDLLARLIQQKLEVATESQKQQAFKQVLLKSLGLVTQC